MGQSEDLPSEAGPDYTVSRAAVEILFWGGVLVLLGHLLSPWPSAQLRMANELPRIAPEALPILFQARLGRVLVLVGGAFLYGSLRGWALKPQALLLLNFT